MGFWVGGGQWSGVSWSARADGQALRPLSAPSLAEAVSRKRSISKGIVALHTHTQKKESEGEVGVRKKKLVFFLLRLWLCEGKQRWSKKQCKVEGPSRETNSGGARRRANARMSTPTLRRPRLAPRSRPGCVISRYTLECQSLTFLSYDSFTMHTCMFGAFPRPVEIEAELDRDRNAKHVGECAPWSDGSQCPTRRNRSKPKPSAVANNVQQERYDCICSYCNASPFRWFLSFSHFPFNHDFTNSRERQGPKGGQHFLCDVPREPHDVG